MNEHFWQMMCDYYPMFALLFVANVVFLVLLTLSWLYGNPDQAASVVTIMALVPIGVSLVLSTYVIRVCRT